MSAEGRAFANTRFHGDGAADLFDVVLDNIHADAASGDIRGLVFGREAWSENQHDLLVLRHFGRLSGSDQPLGDGFGADVFGRDAAPVILDGQNDFATLNVRTEIDVSLTVLTTCRPFFGCFQSMIDATLIFVPPSNE